jgi:hypothetical protein
MGVPAESMVAVLDLLDAAPGGAVGWLRGQGVSQRAVDTWRRRLV